MTMAEAQQQSTALVTQRQGVITKFATAYDLEPAKVLSIVANTIFRANKQEDALSQEEIAAALIVCNAYSLNPFTKEIYAFRSKGKLLIVVGVDGWAAIVNRQSQLNGIEFEEHFNDKGVIQAVTCKIHRKDCALPVVVTEYTHECRRDTIPWQTMPIRMTRNRAFVQCARMAFSISGIVDDDEARTIEGAPEFVTSETKAIIDQAPSKTDAVKAVVAKRAARAAAQEEKPPAQVQQQAQQDPQTAQEMQQAREAEPAQDQQPRQQNQPEPATELW